MEKEIYVYETRKRAYGRGEYQVKRKAKEVKCLDCGFTWLIRKDKKSPLFCRECGVKGERNPMAGKSSWNKGNCEFDQKAYKRNYYNQQRQDRKKEIIKLFGNECSRCKQKNLPICVWHFHHLEGTKKVMAVSQIVSRKMLHEELRKCVMLCANCHYIIHRGDERAE